MSMRGKHDASLHGPTARARDHDPEIIADMRACSDAGA